MVISLSWDVPRIRSFPAVSTSIPDIDELLYTNPKILDAGAIGVPDPIRGESVKVFVVRSQVRP
jgi:acyl-coenzyme A synthetase/AMP-(fatty) acid ligase